MKRLLLVDYFRGIDSTGFAAIRGNGDAKIAKLASHPLDLFDMQRFKDALNGSASRAFIGHNRAATRGAVSSSNAHPFNFGDVTGAHNGTLDYASTSRLQEAVGDKFAVDSMAIFAAIDKIGIEATVALMEEGKTSSDGAWALTWYDNDNDTINILRNQHRPLYYCFNKQCDRLYWASEWHMLESAIRGQVGADFYEDDKKNRFFSFEPDVHYSFKCGELIGGSESKGRPKPTAKPLKGREPVQVQSGPHYDPFSRRESSGTLHGSATQTNTHNYGKTSQNNRQGSRGSTTKSHSSPTVLNLIGDTKHPLAGLITEEAFMKLAKYGCSFCSKDVEFEDEGIAVFERDEKVLCAECVAIDHTRIVMKSLDDLV